MFYGKNTFLKAFTITAPRVMLSVLLHWPAVSEVNVGGMAIEVKPSGQYSVVIAM